VSRSRNKTPCSGCAVNKTRSGTGLCTRCRADIVPVVYRDEAGLIRFCGLALTTHAAIALAHKIADEVDTCWTSAGDHAGELA
jgi:hypothetical protein